MMKKSSPAFTLIEMLTVIAIVVLLAGMLMPVLLKARGKGLSAVAQSDIAGLSQALRQYQFDFGVFPPDDGRAGYHLSNGDANINIPAEALVFFLATEFKKKSGENGDMDLNTPSSPHATPLQWTGSNKGIAFARVTAGPYYELKAGQKRNYDGDQFEEFCDPWGRPYLYNAPGGYGGDPKHNKSSFDLFSVGPNGRTNKKTELYDPTASFSEAIMNQYEDGNDVLNGNSYSPPSYTETDADDINNW